ncbi:MAG: DNA-binding transcriptional MerR regulator [Saprospiraceae bacterium]|jgi:DNA-binding transcriptional MerR regulator
MVVYSISDLEKLSGVKAHTLRIWEKRYGILKPKRTESNIRYYLDEDLRLLLNISLLNKHGLKISKIAEMCPIQLQKKVSEITEIDPSFEGQIDALTISLIELNEGNAVKIINKNIEEKGFKDTMLEVIYPLLDKLVLMWLSGSINAVHEKFVTHLIKRKCCAEIDALKTTRDETFFIYLPTESTDELSLLFLHYLIKSYGFQVIDAGVNVDLIDIQEALEIRKPDCIFTILNNEVSHNSYISYVKELCRIAPSCDIYISGSEPADDLILLHDQLHFLKSYQETIEHLNSLKR